MTTQAIPTNEGCFYKADVTYTYNGETKTMEVKFCACCGSSHSRNGSCHSVCYGCDKLDCRGNMKQLGECFNVNMHEGCINLIPACATKYIHPMNKKLTFCNTPTKLKCKHSLPICESCYYTDKCYHD